MNRDLRLTAFWLMSYLLLAIGPLLAVMFLGDLPPYRGFWIEFSAALGFIALAMFALQFVLTARFRKIAAPHGLDTIIQFHREAGLVAVAFALLHPLITIVQAPAYIEFLDPRVRFRRAVLLIGVISAMVLIIVLTFLRQSMGIPYEATLSRPPGSFRRDRRAGACHPASMMNMAEKCLLQLGVPSRNIHSERFDIA
jgi:3-phenylpropionate/trans-cinnamate dioxygenase ferredoxin reductase subunit